MPVQLTRVTITALFGVYDIDVEISDNTMVIVGENGTGKSTLISLIYYALTASGPDWQKSLSKSANSQSMISSIDLGVTTGLASPSFPYFAVEPLVFLRHVEVPEGIPLAIEVGGS